MIKVLLVDDQQILAEGIKSVLETSNEVEVSESLPTESAP